MKIWPLGFGALCSGTTSEESDRQPSAPTATSRAVAFRTSQLHLMALSSPFRNQFRKASVGTLVPAQLPAHVHGRAAEQGPRAWAPAPTWETWKKRLASDGPALAAADIWMVHWKILCDSAFQTHKLSLELTKCLHFLPNLQRLRNVSRKQTPAYLWCCIVAH